MQLICQHQSGNVPHSSRFSALSAPSCPFTASNTHNVHIYQLGKQGIKIYTIVGHLLRTRKALNSPFFTSILYTIVFVLFKLILIVLFRIQLSYSRLLILTLTLFYNFLLIINLKKNK